MFEFTKNNLNLIIDEVKVGYILYDEKEDFIAGTHIYLNPDERGKGYSSLLIEEFVKFSKENNKKIYPTCPVIKHYLESTYPELIK